MSDRTPGSPADHGRDADPNPGPGADADTPVGDMFEDGQTDIGPLPSLTNVENLAQADLPSVAETVGEADPDPDA